MDCQATCPYCGHTSRYSADVSVVYCPRCHYRFHLWDDDDDDHLDDTPDYGGATDAMGNVFSDADPGL